MPTRDESTADIIADMYKDGDTKVKDFASRLEAADCADRFELSVKLDNVESVLRWIGSSTALRGGVENWHGLANLIAMAADKLYEISHAHLVGGNGGEA